MRLAREHKKTALYHWTDSDPDCFTATPTETQVCFSPKARGRVFCVDDPFKRGGTTKKIKARTLLIFTGESLNLFEKHPLLTLDGFKWFFGQYWATQPGDIIWDTSQARRSKGSNVWVINNARFIKKSEINNEELISRNKKQIWRNFLAGIFVSGVPILAMIMTLACFFLPNSYPVIYLGNISVYIGISSIRLFLIIAAIIIPGLVFYNMTIRPRLRTH